MSFTPVLVEACERNNETRCVSRRSLTIHPLNTHWKKRLVSEWSPIIQSAGDSRRWPDREWDYSAIESEAHFNNANPRGSVWVSEFSERSVVVGMIMVSGPCTMPATTEALTSDRSVVWLENVAISPRLRRDCPPQHRLPFDVLRLGQLMAKWAIQESSRCGCSGWIGLHADGEAAAQKYGPRASDFPSAWDMRPIGVLAHRAGGSYSAFVGDDAWSTAFVRGLDEALAKEIGS